MIINSAKSLFYLNPERCPNNSFGLVKNNLCKLFANETDWTYGIKCNFGSSRSNLIALICLEGIDFGLYVSPESKFIFHCIEKKDLNDKEASKYHSFPSTMLKENAFSDNTFVLNYNHSLNSYKMFLNSNLIFEKSLEQRIEIDFNLIKLFCICRQFISLDRCEKHEEIKLSNLILSNKIISPEEVDLFFNNQEIIEKDSYQRSILSTKSRADIVAYYTFSNNLHEKIWDLSCNNNFLFTSVDMRQRVGNSAI